MPFSRLCRREKVENMRVVILSSVKDRLERCRKIFIPLLPQALSKQPLHPLTSSDFTSTRTIHLPPFHTLCRLLSAEYSLRSCSSQSKNMRVPTSAETRLSAGMADDALSQPT